MNYFGQYYDEEANTYYLRARYYNPVIGKSITEDSFTGNPRDPLSLNRYTYCANNPIIFVDPSGHKKVVLFDSEPYQYEMSLWKHYANTDWEQGQYGSAILDYVIYENKDKDSLKELFSEEALE